MTINQKIEELKELDRTTFDLYASPPFEGVALTNSEFDGLLTSLQKCVEALQFECGNRCAEQNPCNAKETLAEVKKNLGVPDV